MLSLTQADLPVSKHNRAILTSFVLSGTFSLVPFSLAPFSLSVCSAMVLLWPLVSDILLRLQPLGDSSAFFSSRVRTVDGCVCDVFPRVDIAARNHVRCSIHFNIFSHNYLAF